MLVLALQFSKGDMRMRNSERSSTQRRLRMWRIHSLKTEEKTVTAGDCRSREGPNP